MITVDMLNLYSLLNSNSLDVSQFLYNIQKLTYRITVAIHLINKNLYEIGARHNQKFILDSHRVGRVRIPLDDQNASLQTTTNFKDMYATVCRCIDTVRRAKELIRLINTIEDSTYLENDVVIFDDPYD